MIRKTYPTYSVVPSEELQAPGIIRQQRGANPVNTSDSGHRETAPLEAMATPRVKHPKLNREPWSTTYAQSRHEGKTQRPKTRYRRQRRQQRERRGRGYSR